MLSEISRSSLPRAETEPEVQSEAANPHPQATESAEIGNFILGTQTFSEVARGQIVEGKVVKVTEEDVLVDLGMKCEGSIPRSEFIAGDGRLSVGPGDVVEVWIEYYDEKEGLVSVSRQKAAHLKTWEKIERTFQDQTTLQGYVVDRTKGGLIVDVGVRAFLPGSHADVRPLHNLDSLLGQKIDCKVIKINKKRDNVVLSRKLALEEESRQCKAALLERLVEGAELVGRVKNLTDYGVFIDLGGMDGLLHITDLSWGRVGHPSEVIQVGQEIRVKILKYDRERERISLGFKQLSPDPWERMPSTYPVGARVKGRVTSVVDYGAFVELEPGVEGLIHISEMTWSKRLRHPSKIVNVGNLVEVAVLDVNPGQRRISLSLRQTLPDPWTTLGDQLAVGSVVEGRVQNLTDFGAFVEIEEGVDGLIHLSELSRFKKLKHPSEVLKKGQKLEAVVLRLDPAQRRLSLGLKELEPDAWEEFISKTQIGSVVRGKVSGLAPFGAFVELKQGIEGLCHVSEFDDEHSFGGQNGLEVGHELDFRVIRLNLAEKKIGLSLKNANQASRAGSEEVESVADKPAGTSASGGRAGIAPPHPLSAAKVEP